MNKIWSSNFILLTLSNFLMYVTYYSIISTLPVYLVTDLHAGKNEVGIVLAAYTVASVLVRPLGGFSLDRFGRQTVFVIALFFYTGFFLGYLIASSLILLMILRFLHGLTWGISTIGGSTIAVDIVPAEKRGEGIGYFGLSTTLGMSIGPVTGLFLEHHFGYSLVFVAGTIISAISMVCALLLKLPQPLQKEPPGLSLHNLFERKVILPSLNLLIIMSTYGGLLSFIALYGKQIGVQNSSLFFLVFSVGIASSRIFAGKSFDQHGPGKILSFCLWMMMAGFPILVVFPNVAGFYASALIIGFGIGVVFPVFQAMVNNLALANRRGAANSTLYTFLDLGMGAGMVIMGYVAEFINIQATFLISTGIILTGFIIFRKFTLSYYNRNCRPQEL